MIIRLISTLKSMSPGVPQSHEARAKAISESHS